MNQEWTEARPDRPIAPASPEGKPLNIVLVTHRYPTPDRPELVSDVEALAVFARRWAAAGHRVTVVHLYQHENRDARTKPRLYDWWIRVVPMDGVTVLRIECRYIRRLPALGRRFFESIAQKLSGALGTPDLMLVHFPTALNGFGDRLLPGLKRACVLHVTDINKMAKRPALYKAIRLGYAAVGFRSRAIERAFRTQTEWDGEGFMVFSGAPDLPAAPVRRAPDGVLRVIFAGKLIARKEPALIVRALSALPAHINWRLTIAGEGPERAAIEQLTAERGLGERVTLTGAVPREAVLREMAEHDVFVMLSHGETFGLVYLEAMACGLIPIGTRGEGIDGVIVDGENGFLLERGDEAGLSALLERIFDMSPERRARLLQAAMATAGAMGEADMAAVYLDRAQQALIKSARGH